MRDAQPAFERALALGPQAVEGRIGLATALVAAIIERWSRSVPDDQARVEELLAEVFARGANDSMARYASPVAAPGAL